MYEHERGRACSSSQAGPRDDMVNDDRPLRVHSIDCTKDLWNGKRLCRMTVANHSVHTTVVLDIKVYTLHCPRWNDAQLGIRGDVG